MKRGEVQEIGQGTGELSLAKAARRRLFKGETAGRFVPAEPVLGSLKMELGAESGGQIFAIGESAGLFPAPPRQAVCLMLPAERRAAERLSISP
jgi:hypothetical protein